MKRSVFLLTSLIAAAACNGEVTGLEPPSNPATETFAATLGVDISQMTRLPSGVYVQDVSVGTGDEVKAESDTAVVTYAAYLKDGTLFSSGTNVRFRVDSLIAGVRTGLVGMKVGGRRRLVIPSAMGYGRVSIKKPDGTILIPRQSTLVFDLDLTRVHTPTPTPPPS